MKQQLKKMEKRTQGLMNQVLESAQLTSDAREQLVGRYILEMFLLKDLQTLAASGASEADLAGYEADVLAARGISSQGPVAASKRGAV